MTIRALSWFATLGMWSPMPTALLIIGAALVGWALFVAFVVPPAVAFVANRFWKLDDAGPPPISGHGKVTSDD